MRMERHEQIPVIVAKFFNEARDTNPYASAATLRSLDHVIRTGLADSMAHAAAAWRMAYQEQNRIVGTPTRENPFPDRDAMAKLRLIKETADAASEWVSRIHALEAPSNDRVYHRIRDNDQLLELLIDVDYQLAAAADAIEQATDGLKVQNAEERLAAFRAQLDAFANAVRERSRLIKSVPA